ncbi:unnamed protein product [Closterium sp. NIES-65]|nr:unnamed protein product [Closterium sp. NIES-65]
MLQANLLLIQQFFCSHSFSPPFLLPPGSPQGLHSYLSKHAYANTVTNDLWNSLAEASGKPVREMMVSWTAQMGYPLISILPPSPGKQGVRLRQTRFLSKGPPSEAEDKQLWWVPVTATTGRVGGGEGKKLDTVVLSEKEGEAEGFVVPEGEGGWLRVNAGQTGIFRVNYTEEQWKGISAAVEALQLPVIDRLGSAMDAFALAKAGTIKTSQLLPLFSHLAPPALLHTPPCSRVPLPRFYPIHRLCHGRIFPGQGGHHQDQPGSISAVITCPPPSCAHSLRSSLSQLPGSVMDAFALAKAGIIKTSQALQLAWAFKNETEYTVWAQIAGDIGELEILIGALQQKPLLEAVGMQLFTPIADKLGWEPKAGESHLDSMLRPLVLGKLGSYQHAPTIAKCQELFKQLTADVSSVNPDLRRVVMSVAVNSVNPDLRRVVMSVAVKYGGKAEMEARPLSICNCSLLLPPPCLSPFSSVNPDLRRVVMSVAVKYGGKAEMEATKKLYREATTPDFKIHCLVALSSVKDRELYKDFLAFALDETEVKAQDQYIVFMTMAGNAANREFAIVFMTMAGNADNREYAWEYFKEHFDAIHARFASAAALFARIPALPLKGFATEDKARDAEAFFAAHPVPAAAMELDRTLETIRARAAWLARDGDDIVSWLKSKAS